jgi:16S rRNA (adenine1518-N6/adenine1519-N6)-dimethyltransferase
MTILPLDVRSILREFNISPKKSLGQNFLVDQSALQKIVAAAEVNADCSVLEVGPGLGSLTRLLAQSARQVVAVELDQRLLPVLEKVLAPFNNVKVAHGDILDLDPTKLLDEDGYRVVANIPYYITSALIRHLLEAERKPSMLVLTVQKEVAERICAGPGDMSLLALSVQVYGKPKIVGRIPAGAFYPAPNVDSSTLRVDLYAEPLIPSSQLDVFFKIAKAGFGQKRKMLRNALAGGLHLSSEKSGELLESSGVQPTRRAETLSLEEWGKLVEAYLFLMKPAVHPD